MSLDCPILCLVPRNKKLIRGFCHQLQKFLSHFDKQGQFFPKTTNYVSSIVVSINSFPSAGHIFVGSSCGKDHCPANLYDPEKQNVDLV